MREREIHCHKPVVRAGILPLHREMAVMMLERVEMQQGMILASFPLQSLKFPSLFLASVCFCLRAPPSPRRDRERGIFILGFRSRWRCRHKKWTIADARGAEGHKWPNRPSRPCHQAYLCPRASPLWVQVLQVSALMKNFHEKIQGYFEFVKVPES